MRIYLLILLLIGSFSPIIGQTILTKSNGDTLRVQHFRTSGKTLKYWKEDISYKMKLSEVQQIDQKGLIFKPISIDGKSKFLSVLIEESNRILAMESKTIKRSRGGFEIKMQRYKLWVIHNNAIVDQLVFTDGIRIEDQQERAKISVFITRNFAYCSQILKELLYYEHDPSHKILLQWFDTATTKICP